VRILIVVGARPQFIKASPIVDAFEEVSVHPCIVHTGQHYDDEMSEVFFREMNIAQPDVNLGVRSLGQGRQVGEMLAGLENVMVDHEPEWVVVVGDTNSTLAGALAAAKLRIPLAHVEAGLRSYNRAMPEEINRVVADHVSDLLFVPTSLAAESLRAEGIAGEQVVLVGDVMYDAYQRFSSLVPPGPARLRGSGSGSDRYALATIHRAENTDDSRRLGIIIDALGLLAEEMAVIFPMHPRTRARLSEEAIAGLISRGVQVINPVGYLTMLSIERHAAVIVTDSGGVQKEAYFAKVPCVTLRNETEWTELVTAGWNRLCPPGDSRTMAALISAAAGYVLFVL
jgi:UDP-GlcNAc3NAcA epimerase